MHVQYAYALRHGNVLHEAVPDIHSGGAESHGYDCAGFFQDLPHAVLSVKMPVLFAVAY